MTVTGTFVGSLIVPAPPPVTVHAWVLKLPSNGGAVTVIAVGVIEVGVTVLACPPTAAKSHFTRMFGSLKFVPVMTMSEPACGTEFGVMAVTFDAREETR